MIMLQLVGVVSGTIGLIWAAIKLGYPVGYHFAVKRFGQAYLDEMLHTFAPLLWFALGYAIVVLLRSRVSTIPKCVGSGAMV